MNPIFLISMIIWIFSNELAKCELFTAMADFEETLSEEKIVLDTITQYVERREAKLEMLRRYSAKLKKEEERIREDMRLFAHPVAAFHLIKHLTDEYQNMKNLVIDNAEGLEAISNITHGRKQDGVQFPTQEDVTGAAVGLFRLQDTYNLKTHEMADGRIDGVEYSPKLTAAQCFELGLEAYELKSPDYYHSLLWLQEAYDRFQTEYDEPSMQEAEIVDYLSYSLYEQGNLERAAYLVKKLKSLDPHRKMVDQNLDWYKNVLREKGIPSSVMDEEDELPPLKITKSARQRLNKEFIIYESLCRGEHNKKPTPDLYCYYKWNNPFIRLARLKAELIHRKPKLILFRDAVSTTESRLIRELGAPKLERAMIANANGELEPASYRISKSGWLTDEEHGTVARISKRIEDMTDLTTRTAEALQIANYGIGGHYETHYDFAQKHEKNSFKRVGKGNRISTVLFYLTEPSAGGATVFPKLNLTLYPSENDAVVWYNLYKSGDGDLELRHAACPVLSGIKWVANKWLHEYGQEFIRPCALDELEYE